MENTKRITQVSEYKTATVLIGANVFLSTQEAKAILKNTEFRSAPQDISSKEAEEIYQKNVAMADEARQLLRKIAKAVLYTEEEDISLLSIADEFIKKEIPSKPKMHSS